MSFFSKRTFLSAVTAIFVLAGNAAMAATQTLDWDTLTWPDSSQSQSYVLGNGSVNFSMAGNTAALDGIVTAGTPPIAPGIRNVQEGGFGGAEQSLHFAKDYPPGTTQADYEISIIMDFTHPGGVEDVTFTLFDVDRSNNVNNFWDRVVVTATAVGGGSVDPSSIVLPGLGFNQLNPSSPSNTVEGTASSQPNTGNANATFTFNQRITQVLIQWRYPIEGPDNDPNRKVIALHDITINDPEADVSVSKLVDNNNPQVGQNVVFTLTAANAGPDAASGVEITDALPAGYTFVSAVGDGTYTSGTGLWDIGAIASGGSATIDITATVNATGPYTNTATITGANEIDPDPTNNSDSNTPVIDLLPSASADTNTATEGGADATGDVLANDTLGDGPTTVTAADQGGTPITLGSPFTTANGGTLTLNSDGTYTYTP
ncbi:MAG: DUF11 domain-containing protein, partial [Gammaproteobacteria bacterium]|nr:DUF11 domain-containing protein [Gammaproteobacteria bacterium]